MSRQTPSYKEEIRRAEQLRQSGQALLAADVLRKILDRDKENFAANYYLGMLHHKAGRNDLAIPFLEKSVELRPTVFEAVINLGIIQREEGLLAPAQSHLESAVTIRPDSAIAHITLGMLLIDRDQLDAALAEVEKGLQLDPDNPDTWAKLGMLMQIRGEPAEAAGYFRKVIERNPLNGAAHHSLALLQQQTKYNDDIKRMEDAIRAPDIECRDRILLGYALGKVFDDLGQYDKAFDYLNPANQLQHRSIKYSFEKQKAFFERHKVGLDQAFLSHCGNHAVTDRTAIFVLGMPRSGTSLVEQILASHPLVCGAGEVEYTRLMADAVEKKTRKPFPQDIGTVSPEVLRDAGLAYVAKLRFNAAGAERVIDKLPHNFLRIGLIAAVMPNARIILCERSPLDNCLSIYQHDFVSAHAYSSDLRELGRYYRLYQDLMDWWEQILPGHICRVNYEELVSDTENQVKRLLAYCDLPFDENCLSSHQTRRPVKTPSASQVREPIYQGSIDRWKNYEKHLEPLRAALEGAPATT